MSDAAPPPTEAAAPSPPPWVGPLLSSPLFAEQKQLGGRAVPADEVGYSWITLSPHR